VRLFASDPSQNFGWFILGDESIAGTARRFDSCDSAAAGGVVPQLEIEFTSVPNPGPLALLVLAGLFASSRKRG
jgi:MYXO-CTERM domain-containing protein